MTIIDHLSVGVSDLQQAETFYNAALGELNILPLAKNEMFLAFGEHRVEFLAMLPRDGNSHSCGNGTHICFPALWYETHSPRTGWALQNKYEFHCRSCDYSHLSATWRGTRHGARRR
ncbi:MAG: hypothetical protein AAGM33_05705, partial [Pseudomonadota bacterium]